MADIIVAFPNTNDARAIKNVLVKNGYSVMATVLSGAAAIQAADDIDYGIVLSAYQFIDMQYLEMKSYLNESCRMLLICSPSRFDELPKEVDFLPMPFKVIALLDKVQEISIELDQERKKKKTLQERSQKTRQDILRAKEILMARKGMTEPQAHKYLQKSSMENGVTLGMTAKKILSLYR